MIGGSHAEDTHRSVLAHSRRHADVDNPRVSRATLADAYFGFLTFYAWVFYRETSPVSRSVWLLLILLLGNIAMSIYMLIALGRMQSDHPAELLLRREHRE